MRVPAEKDAARWPDEAALAHKNVVLQHLASARFCGVFSAKLNKFSVIMQTNFTV